MRVTIEKLPGVASAAISLNQGRAIVQLKPGNTTTMAQVRQSVERNGFTPQQAVVSAEADVIATGDKVRLRISGTNDTYELASTPDAGGVLQQLRKSAGQRVAIDGIVPWQRDRRATPVIEVKRVTPVTR